MLGCFSSNPFGKIGLFGASWGQKLYLRSFRNGCSYGYEVCSAVPVTVDIVAAELYDMY